MTSVDAASEADDPEAVGGEAEKKEEEDPAEAIEDGGDAQEKPADVTQDEVSEVTGDTEEGNEDTAETEAGPEPGSEAADRQEEGEENCGAGSVEGSVEGIGEESAGTEETLPEGEPENSGEDLTVRYVVTIKDGSGNTAEVMGGEETLIADILRELGYEIEEGTEIELDPDSIDPAINVTRGADGELILTDNGPFGRAGKRLVVYAGGERIELELTDPVGIKGRTSAESIEYVFSGSYSSVMLIGDLTVTDDRAINITEGVHDLYLNGFTLTNIIGIVNALI